jgi:hypothetical protein
MQNLVTKIIKINSYEVSRQYYFLLHKFSNNVSLFFALIMQAVNTIYSSEIELQP